MQCNEHHIAVLRGVRDTDSASSQVLGYAKASGLGSYSDQCRCVGDLVDGGLIVHERVDYRYRLTDAGRAVLDASDTTERFAAAIAGVRNEGKPMPRLIVAGYVAIWLESLRERGGCRRCWRDVRYAAARSDTDASGRPGCLAEAVLRLPECPADEAQARAWAEDNAGPIASVGRAFEEYSGFAGGLIGVAVQAIRELDGETTS